MSRVSFLLAAFLLVLLYSCKDKDDDSQMTTLPVLSVGDGEAQEGTSSNNTISFEVSIAGEYTGTVNVNYETRYGSAMKGVDYESISGTLTFTAPETTKTLEVKTQADETNEANERFTIYLTNEQNATVNKRSGQGLIINDDSTTPTFPGGYMTPATYPEWTLAWGDEFDDSAIDTDSWNFEIGNGEGGWGNNELQNYTDLPENTRTENGHLIITAIKGNNSNYTSARMTTMDKKEFKFGRIDIRAKLPKGQGIWPALWMLGSNFQTVGWPMCGEIDIMELVGHQPSTVHGTIHYGQPSPNNSFIGEPFSIVPNEFIDEFHVFSLVWLENEIHWLVDDRIFYSVNPGSLDGEAYLFNADFFFIFNIAVGGNWPGSPDQTTVFPQVMEVDYIRVFQ